MDGTTCSRDDVVSWPGAIGGDRDRFTFPKTAAGRSRLSATWAGTVRMIADRSTQGRAARDAWYDAAEVPQVGVWINCRGWAPPGRTPYYNLALEPCIGAPDRLGRWR